MKEFETAKQKKREDVRKEERKKKENKPSVCLMPSVDFRGRFPSFHIK